MALNNIVCWDSSSGEYGGPLHCNYSLICSDSEVLVRAYQRLKYNCSIIDKWLLLLSLLLLLLLLFELFTQALTDGFSLELKWELVSSSLQDSYQYFDLTNAIVWMASTCRLISKFSSPCTSPFVAVPRAPITIGITVTFMFHSFF